MKTESFCFHLFLFKFLQDTTQHLGVTLHGWAHLSEMLLADCRKRAWSVSFSVWSACVMRAEDRSMHCLQLEICWASFRMRTTWAQGTSLLISAHPCSSLLITSHLCSSLLISAHHCSSLMQASDWPKPLHGHDTLSSLRMFEIPSSKMTTKKKCK